MRRLFTLFAACVWAVSAFAQTPEEILSRMDEEMSKHEDEGIIMTVDVKIPILGTMSTRTYALGDKYRIEAETMGVKIITWSDGVSEWTYDSKKNEVEIKKADPNKSTESEGDAELFSDITDGYDVTLQKETEKAWHFVCKKSKTNPDKDAPKTMDLVVAKGTYYPVSLTAKVSGFTMTMRDIEFGVTERQVTFNPAECPGATIIDKR